MYRAKGPFGRWDLLSLHGRESRITFSATTEKMPTKRFKIKKQWTNSKVWAFTAVLLVLISAALTGMTGHLWIMWTALSISALGFIVSYKNDRAGKVSYGIENGQLVLKNTGVEERISFDRIRDASLLDRVAARDLLRQRVEGAKARGANPEALKEIRKRYVRFCTVDIGLNSITFGIGRQLVDQRPDAKNDLVLIRTTSGEAFLISPFYNQDTVESLNRAIQRDMPLGKSA